MWLIPFIKKYRYLLLVIVLVVVAIFYLHNDITSVSSRFFGDQTKKVSTYLRCTTKVLDASILNASKTPTGSIKLLIHFNEKPSSDVRDFFAANGVTLYPNTWIYDYLVGETTVDKLCFLAGLPGITSIALGE